MAGSIPFTRGSDGAPPTLLTALLYFACALALLRVSDGGGIAVFSCANAVLLSALLLRERAQWWRPLLGCAIAVFAANLLTGRGMGLSLAFAAGDLVTPLIAAALLHRAAGADAVRTDTPGSIALFIILAGITAPVLGATVGGALVSIGFGTELAVAWVQWFATEAAGILLGTPLLLMLWTGELAEWFTGLDRRQLGTTGLLLAAVALVALVAFRLGFAPLLFLPAVLIVVTAFFAGRVGGAVSVLIVAGIGSAFTMHAADDLLAAADPRAQVLFLQAYLATVLLTALPVAASREEGRRLQAALTESEERYRVMAEHSGDLIAWVDTTGVCVYASSAAPEMTGYPASALMASSNEHIVHVDDVAETMAHHARMVRSNGEVDSIVFRAWHRDGRLLWLEARTRAMFAADRTLIGVQWAIRDVTAQKSNEETLREAANSDPLTALPNRRAFFTLLDIAIAGARSGDRPLALAVIDLDHFKEVNDRFGHEAGDATLRAAAQAVQRVIRGEDVFARIGGEEFGLVMPGVALDVARTICERVRASVAAIEVPVSEGNAIRVTLSAGLTLLAADDDATALVRAADRALYAGKQAGRDCVMTAARDASPA